ncbi:MAG: hypothetical protein WCG91_01735 [Candidatus Shapirobacteria bacterium]
MEESLIQLATERGLSKLEESNGITYFIGIIEFYDPTKKFGFTKNEKNGKEGVYLGGKNRRTPLIQNSQLELVEKVEEPEEKERPMKDNLVICAVEFGIKGRLKAACWCLKEDYQKAIEKIK